MWIAKDGKRRAGPGRLLLPPPLSPLLERGRPEIKIEMALDDVENVAHAENAAGELVPLQEQSRHGGGARKRPSVVAHPERSSWR